MAAITWPGNNDATPGGGGAGRLVRASGRVGVKIIVGTFDFDSSYPTNGELFADANGVTPWERMPKGQMLAVWVEDPVLSAGTGKRVVVDYTNKKLKLVTNAATPAEVANASDQSGAVGLHFICIGY